MERSARVLFLLCTILVAASSIPAKSAVLGVVGTSPSIVGINPPGSASDRTPLLVNTALTAYVDATDDVALDHAVVDLVKNGAHIGIFPMTINGTGSTTSSVRFVFKITLTNTSYPVGTILDFGFTVFDNANRQASRTGFARVVSCPSGVNHCLPIKPNRDYWGTFYYPWYGRWQFERNPGTPLTCGSQQCLGHTEPEVISVNSTLYLYYRTDHSIAVARNSSNDGTRWTDINRTAIGPSPSGWDSAEVIAPSVIQVRGTYYLFYEATNNTSTGPRAIGVATSTGPIENFTKYPGNPILTASGGWEGHIIGTPVVTKIGSMFYMFYHGFDGNHDRIGIAYSSDLLHWTKETSNPILDVGQQRSWDSAEVAPSSTNVAGPVVWLFYEGFNEASWRIGIASGIVNQTDMTIKGLTKDPSPILDLGLPGSFDDHTVQLPSVILSPDRKQLWMYYSGNDGSAFRLGRAVASVQDTLRHWKDALDNNCFPCSYNPPATWSSMYLPDDGTGVYSTANLYSSMDVNIINRHLTWMDRAGFDFALVSWWGQGSYEDTAFKMMLNQTTLNSSLVKLAIYYEEGLTSPLYPSLARIEADLNYTYDHYANSNSYFKVSDGTRDYPVVFVYGNRNDPVNFTATWSLARDYMYRIRKPVFISLKAWEIKDANGTIIDSSQNHPFEADSWHQYGPALPKERPQNESYYAYVSPGFALDPEIASSRPRGFARNATLFAQNVTWLAKQNVTFHLIEAFNEWHEGSQIEPGFLIDHNDTVGFSQAGRSYGLTFIDIVRSRGFLANFTTSARFSDPTVGSPTVFSAKAIGGAQPYTYYWSFDDGASATGNFVTHNYSTPGLHTVILTVHDSSAVMTMTSETFTVWKCPDVTGDGAIDIGDLIGVYLHEFTTSNPQYDLNADGRVDKSDLNFVYVNQFRAIC